MPLFLQDAVELFDAVAGLNPHGVLASFASALGHVRDHLVAAVRYASPSAGAEHGELCYHVQAGTSLLFAMLDGLAVFVELKLQGGPGPGTRPIYWSGATTFLDPRFAGLRAIQQRTLSYAIRGGITAQTLCNFAKHYLPWLHLASVDRDGTWDVRFPLGNQGHASGPLLHGLLFPLFDDARAACVELAGVMGVGVPGALPGALVAH
jgi:hypothetical protein